MNRRPIPTLILGLAGLAVLVGLGVWQMQRQAWKADVLAGIEARSSAEPGPLPARPAQGHDRYRPVRLSGEFGAGVLRVLVSRKQQGAGYRLISPFQSGERRVLVDRGLIPVATEIPPPPAGQVVLTGNLHWPDDRTAATPENDVAANIWYARDIAAMAEALETEPVLVIARDLSRTDPGVTPLPVDTAAIPNDHLAYALTWFSLAAVWAGMAGALIWRMRDRAKGEGR